MYILLENNVVKERIPDMNPDLPGVPLEQRYPKAFVESLIYVEGDLEVPEGYIYDAETGAFHEPPEQKAEPTLKLTEPEPTQLDIIEAQITYTAMMTDTLLEG